MEATVHVVDDTVEIKDHKPGLQLGYSGRWAARMNVKRKSTVCEITGKTVQHKTCTICKNMLEMECFREIGDGKYASICVDCNKARAIAAREGVTEKICSKCNAKLPVNEFRVMNDRPTGLQSFCHTCEARMHCKRNETKHGFLLCVLNGCRSRAREWVATSREITGPMFSLTVEDLISMATEQNDKCYYSGVPLKYAPLSGFQASPERLDCNAGYTRANCRLVALELNHRSQWSAEVIKNHLQLRQILPTDSEVKRISEECRKPPKRQLPRRAMQKEEGGRLLGFCYWCEKWVAISDISPYHKTLCKVCRNIWMRARNPYIISSILLASANNAVVTRNERIKRQKINRTGASEMTHDDIADMVLQQGNKCYYSGVPLDWSPTASHWAPSQERLDVKLTYTRANVRLVCRVFNCSDSTLTNVHHKYEDEENKHGWSPAKYELFLVSATEKYRFDVLPVLM